MHQLQTEGGHVCHRLYKVIYVIDSRRPNTHTHRRTHIYTRVYMYVIDSRMYQTLTAYGKQQSNFNLVNIDQQSKSKSQVNVVGNFNPLTAELFLLPFAGHRVNSLQTFTLHGLSFSMFTVCTDFFLSYSCFPI